jgi:hypothetical protein
MRRLHAPLAAVLGLAALAPPAAGYDEPPLTSYTRPSPNKMFVFVMLQEGPRTGGKDPVREQYSKSGLYRADRPAAPVWVYPDGYAREAYPASDGLHVVVQHLKVISPDPRTCGNSPPEPPANPTVLTFYASGKKVRDVRLGELLDHVRFCRDKGPGWHPWLVSARVDDAAEQFVVETVDGRTTRLALPTGLTEASTRAGGPVDVHDEARRAGRPWGVALGVGLLLAAVLGVVLLSVVLFRSRPHPDPLPDEE